MQRTLFNFFANRIKEATRMTGYVAATTAAGNVTFYTGEKINQIYTDFKHQRNLADSNSAEPKTASPNH